MIVIEKNTRLYTSLRASQEAEMVKNLPAMWKTWVWSLCQENPLSGFFLCQENPLEEGMSTHSSILAWRIPWTEEPGGLQFIGSQRVGHDWSDLAHTHALLLIVLWCKLHLIVNRTVFLAPELVSALLKVILEAACTCPGWVWPHELPVRCNPTLTWHRGGHMSSRREGRKWSFVRSAPGFHYSILCASRLFLYLFLKFYLFFNWRIIALQNFAVFCQTSIWISHRCTHIPSFLKLPVPSHPTPLSWYRAPVWVSWAIQQILIDYLFNIC